MKKHFLSLMTVFAGFSMLTSCSDKDDTKYPVPEAATFTETNGLNLTVGGVAMLGKTVKFEPLSDGSKGTFTMSSTFDLTAIPGYQEGMIKGNLVQAPGVLPGSPVTAITVDLDYNGSVYSFSGADETEYCTFSYSGTLEGENLNLAINDVKLKNTTFAGTTWNLAEMDPENPDALNGPIRIVWEPYDLENPDNGASVDVGFMKMPLQTIMQLMTVIPMIANPADPEGSQLTVSEILNYVLKSITFMEDGNIVAEYRDMNKGQSVTTSPVNLVQYVVKGNGELLIFLNPQAIAIADKTRALDINSLLATVMVQVLPMLANGVPMAYQTEGDNLSLYLNTPVLLPLLKNTLTPLLQDQETIDMLVALMSANEDMAMYLPMIQAALPSLPEALEKTTEVEIGINLVKKS
ncbi:MAG: DUF4925 domain-containing protein [Muribaculaceae bacterium]|nr:DUF4925 domain-containing protein [Muribaculaceae bacterium]